MWLEKRIEQEDPFEGGSVAQAQLRRTLQRRYYLYVPRYQTARPQSQFLHSYSISVSDLYVSRNGLPILLQPNR
jgi:hypothetical protein